MSHSPKKRILNSTKHKKQLTEFEKGQVCAWSKDGVSGRAIARRLKRYPSTINKFLKRFKETQDYKRVPGSGRKRKTTPRADRYIKHSSLKRRKSTFGTNSS